MTAMRTQIRLALAALASDLDALGASPHAALLALEQVGTALRAGVEMPGPLRRWLEALSTLLLSGAIAELRAEVSDWALPSSADHIDEQLGFTIGRRDALESTLAAIMRHCSTARLPPAALAGWSEITDEVARFDERLATVVSRADAESRLGDRAALLGDAPWTAILPEPALQATAEPIAWTDAMMTSPPSDQAVTRYTAEGSLAGFVEGFAARSATFAEELAAVIEALLDVRACVALLPRIWLRKRTQQPATAALSMSLSVLPPIRAAAAVGPMEPGDRPPPLRLGKLTPIDAEALLSATETEVSLSVFPREPNTLVEVALGATVASAPDQDGAWVVTIPRTEGSVRLLVVAKDGTRIEETLQLFVSPSS